MKKRRGILSLLFVFLWGVFFGLGVYIVFLFLGGFSFFDSRVVQKGYASFSSNFPLYLNGEYIKNSNRYNQYEVGGYVLCVDGSEKDAVKMENFKLPVSQMRLKLEIKKESIV
ncbi:TPA: hypothetical protein EYP45_01705, partial [Candidatus Peregrinibacteria bacterium]|nr:hypothetical protein [Candidatus Peregrinibacteria bacterium]